MAPITPINVNDMNRFFDDFAVEQTKDYFESGKYAGGMFERWGGGGDSPENANRFTSDDVVATSFLNIRIPGPTALQILQTDNESLGAQLSQIPTDVDLWEAPDSVVADDSAAEKLWAQLASMGGMSRVAAGKLLARKRPRLIPVYDKLFWRAIARDPNLEWWGAFRQVYQKNPTLIAQLEKLQKDAELPDISLMRLEYALIWMRFWGRGELTPDADS